MSQDLTAEVAGRLEDDEVRARAAAGDLSDFDDLGLDDDQRAALAQLAEDFDEVAGFAMDAFSVLIGGKGLLPPTFHPHLSTANQVSEVKVRAYDPAHKKDIVGTAAPKSPF